VHWSDAMFSTIVDRIAAGELLRQICSVPELPTRKTFFERVAADRNMQAHYLMAPQFRADLYAEETIEIADDTGRDTYIDKDGVRRIDHEAIGRSKLKIEARMWCASKIAPKKYGNRQQVDVDMGPGLKAEELDARIAALMRKAAGGR
jgi:hypothetical protein